MDDCTGYIGLCHAGVYDGLYDAGIYAGDVYKRQVLEALYAMKLLRDSGVKLNKRVRVSMGCNEETGSKCMEHYNEVAEELSCGFTPDARCV